MFARLNQPCLVVLATCRTKPALTPSDEHLRAALVQRGAQVTVAPWDTISTSTECDHVCLRSTWDYHLRPQEFAAWVESWRARPGVLYNPIDTVLWNMDKVYLRDLQAGGIPLPITRWHEPGETPDVDVFLRETGATVAVVKPRVSATAYGTHLVTSDTRPTGAQLEEVTRSGAVLQAFVPEIRRNGELSLMFIDGRFTHAMRKTAATDDFRVQSTFGGKALPATVEAGVQRFGERVLAAARHLCTYARVDMVETNDGPVLMELELIEPELFLDVDPGAASLFAEALLARGRTNSAR